MTPAETWLVIEAAEERERPAYWRAALIAHTTYMLMRGKHSKELKIEDFMPKMTYKPKRQQTVEEQRQVMQAWVMVTGGDRVKR